MRKIPDWDTYFMNILEPISRRSKDPNTQVGCVITGPDNNIRSTGYNSLPRGVRDDIMERYERPEKYMWLEHGDRNAIYAAARVGTPLAGCKMYLTGIVEVIYDGVRQDAWAQTTPRYVPDFERVRILLDEAGVKLTEWRDI